MEILHKMPFDSFDPTVEIETVAVSRTKVEVNSFEELSGERDCIDEAR
ncbi:hypothetical protein A2U01_0117399 [Trifolium medium]|uniref:Uncharacterized protein n=1 Tax=Trifolium medium TaxID=97028 RepID=A0A392WBI5_9FABA|nr:hypothetical protein [Trifolium medium]